MSKPIEVLQTQQWLEEIIVGLNFCPFAKKELVNDSIYYHLSKLNKIKTALVELIDQCKYLHENPELETSLVIYPTGFRHFERYLELVEHANELLISSGYEGIFQLASFHPEYVFAGDDFDDAANFTNRSPYPTIHIIREDSLAKVLSVYKNPEQIPVNNIELAREKGVQFFEQVLNRIHEQHE
ncbi:MAG: DUF1415 domain-containing protein [Colwellia sp.]|nr:DUF1415 domain-containing protein [Colwellia sp.]